MKVEEGTKPFSKWLVGVLNIEREVKIIKFRGDPSKMSGTIEVRGIVNKDGTMSFGEFTQYDNEFGKIMDVIRSRFGHL